jgi:hypothetical protein
LKELAINTLVREELIEFVQTEGVEEKYVKGVTAVLNGVLMGEEIVTLKKCAIKALYIVFNQNNLVKGQPKDVQEKCIEDTVTALRKALKKGDWELEYWATKILDKLKKEESEVQIQKLEKQKQNGKKIMVKINDTERERFCIKANDTNLKDTLEHLRDTLESFRAKLQSQN